MAQTRRNFLKTSITAMTLAMVSPKLLFGGSGESVFAQTIKRQSSASGRTLVVVEFDGGNDGLNTIVPYADSNYYSARPTLAVAESDVLKIDDKVGFHPNLTKFKALFDQGRIAAVQNVGYPNPDLSHFRSRAIYQRADPNTQEEQNELGWLGKYADLELAESGNLAAVNFGSSLPKTLIADKVIAPSIIDFSLYQFTTDPKYGGDRNDQIEAFKKANTTKSKNSDLDYTGDTALDAFSSSDLLQNGIKNYKSSVMYPNDDLGNQLQMAAQVLAANLGSQIIYLTISGFDTHSRQQPDQEALLTSISDGFDAFYSDLVNLNKADSVLLMTFSEFGRRIKENGSQGTDHGTAGPMFIMGNAVKGGLYGNAPDLVNVDQAGNLIFDIDFRAVYTTILSDWLQADATAVLGGSFENVGFINK
jgi:uncharacterized protein (DUF1501 family)